MENNKNNNNGNGKKKLPVSFKFALLLFFISLQCFLGALYLKERENYYKLESDLVHSESIQEVSLEISEPVPVSPSPQVKVMGDMSSTGKRHIESGKTAKQPEVAVVARAAKAGEIKKRGTLWFDRGNDSYVITIGKKNGMIEGNILNIYDSDKVIGQARVIKSMEKISIVSIDAKDRQNLVKTYYKVSLD